MILTSFHFTIYHRFSSGFCVHRENLNRFGCEVVTKNCVVELLLLYFLKEILFLLLTRTLKLFKFTQKFLNKSSFTYYYRGRHFTLIDTQTFNRSIFFWNCVILSRKTEVFLLKIFSIFWSIFWFSNFWSIFWFAQSFKLKTRLSLNDHLKVAYWKLSLNMIERGGVNNPSTNWLLSGPEFYLRNVSYNLNYNCYTYV